MSLSPTSIGASNRRKHLWAPGDNAGLMRQIIVMLMLAIAVIMPAMCSLVAPPNQTEALLDPLQTMLVTTPTMAAFMSDTWAPSPFLPEILTLSDTKGKPTVLDINKTNKSENITNTTYAIQDFLSDSWTPPALTPTIPYSAISGKKGVTTPQSGLAIEQFLDDTWTPSTQVVGIVSNGAQYTKGQMS
jgi:hypothetical protein